MLINPIPYGESPDSPLNHSLWPGLQEGERLTAVVDADQFVYAAGFACEHSEPIAYSPDGHLLGHWTNKSSYNKWLKENPDVEHDLDFDEWVEDLDSGLLILNMKRKQIREVTHGAKQKWYLTKGSSVWRNDYAQWQPYKGNRTEMRKPVHYDALRSYMKDKMGAKVLKGIEADDAVAYLMRKDPMSTIIVSGDKDLMTVPGLHLNPSKMGDGVFFVSELEACRFLYSQMLSGDSIDNIKGLSGTREHPGWGPVKAKKAVAQFDTEYDMATFVAEQYASTYPDGVMCEDEEGHVTGHLSWQQALVETANLLFLRKDKDTQFVWES